MDMMNELLVIRVNYKKTDIVTLIRLGFLRVVFSEGGSVWPSFHISRRTNLI